MNPPTRITVKQVIADNDSAYAEKFEQIQAQSDQSAAAVQQVSSAYADLSGKLSAQWGVNVQVDSNGNKYVAGMQLGVEGNNGSVQSCALCSADNFALYNTISGSYQLAFAAVNGQTFLRSTFIQDGTIDNGKIGNYIQSINYNGTVEWRIDKGAGFFFGGAGYIYARR